MALEDEGVIQRDRSGQIGYPSSAAQFEAAYGNQDRGIQDDVTYRFNSYSGADIYAIAHYFDTSADADKAARQVILGNIQTLTFSTHREKFPARALGHVGARGYTRGPRTIGGTMIFTVFNKSVLSGLMQLDNMIETSSADAGRGRTAGIDQIVLVDQIPPFDISILFANETGSLSKMAIYGVEMVNEGQTMSIEDLVTESVVSYVARHIDPMTSLLGDDYQVRLDDQLPEGADIIAASFNGPDRYVSWNALTKDATLKAALDTMK